MNERELKYREQQLSELKQDRPQYAPMLKIVAPNKQSTGWLDITHEEFTKIIELLTKQEKNYE